MRHHMGYIECREVMNATERTVRNCEAGNHYALKNASDAIKRAERAYLDTPEVQVAQRLHVAIDRLQEFVQ